MYYFCTFFDRHYLARGLALYHSLRRHCPAFQLWMLCFDEASYEVLARLNLPQVHLIDLASFEQGDEALLQAKKTRSRVEYYFTCTPSLPLYVLRHHPEVDLITYLDADLFFFADPAPIYAEMGDNSIAIIEHRYAPALHSRIEYGIYNVGWLSFRRDDQGLACLQGWRERCLEWCYDRVEPGRYADQKYLDYWPELFNKLIVLKHKGANLAPWSLANYKLQVKEGRVWVDEDPLIFFHFHGFSQITRWLYNSGLMGYMVRLSSDVRQCIYTPYIETLLQGAPVSFLSSNERWQPASLWRRYAKRIAASPQILYGLVTGNYILALRGRII